MTEFELAMAALRALAAATKAVAEAKAVYNNLKEQAQRTREFTPEESSALDALEAEIEASEAQKLSGR